MQQNQEDESDASSRINNRITNKAHNKSSAMKVQLNPLVAHISLDKDAEDTASRTSLYNTGRIMTDAHASHTGLHPARCPMPHGKFVTRMRELFGYNAYMRQTTFDCRDKQLFNCCLKGIKDKHKLHKNRQKGVRIINDIISRADPSYITSIHIINMVWSCMSCMHHFQLRLRSDSKGIVRGFRKREIKDCKDTYLRLINFVDPELYPSILGALLIFYKKGKIWEFEYACTDMILDLLYVSTKIDRAIRYMFDMALNIVNENTSESKHMFQVLYNVLRKMTWHSVSMDTINIFLDAFEKSMCPKPSDKYNYTPVRKSLELCARNAISTMRNQHLIAVVELCMKRINYNENVEEEVLMEVGAIAIFAAKKYKVKTFLDAFSREFMQMFASLTRKHEPTGIVKAFKIWNGIVDRNNNQKVFRTPRIFFSDCTYHLKRNACHRSDRLFFKKYRMLLYKVLVHGFVTAQLKWHLELLYQMIALTLTEIPCGYTVSTAVAVIMYLQDHAFKISSDDLLKAHHLHAIVLSLMSLVCYIHKADILYKYVIEIMDRRAEWAPHLNPPLATSHDYSVHHILWNQPNLFFHDWEAGYGLWKCFREKKKKKKVRIK